jgi:hypothetical protein
VVAVVAVSDPATCVVLVIPKKTYHHVSYDSQAKAQYVYVAARRASGLVSSGQTCPAVVLFSSIVDGNLQVFFVTHEAAMNIQ